MAAWMAFTVVVGALVALAAMGGEALARLAGVPTRFVWATALLLTLALSALGPTRSSLDAAASPAVVLEATAVFAVEKSGAPAATASPLLAAVSSARHGLAWPARAAASLAEDRASAVLAVMWLALSAGLAAVVIGTLLRYRSARRKWPSRQIAGVHVRMAPGAGPAVLGLLRPEIVVPAWLLTRPIEEQRLVVLHEREHVRARDAWTLAVGWAAVVLVPWSPVSWWMQARLRLAVELDCDARVLRRGVSPRAYGSALIDMAGREPGLSLGLAARPRSPSILERRLLIMTESFSRLAILRATALGALGGLALLAACDARLPTAAEVEAMDAASAEAATRQWRVGGDTITYILDGVEVTAEEAHAVAGERLASVEVVRGPGQGNAVIRLTSGSAEKATGRMANGSDIHAGQITVVGDGFHLRTDAGDNRVEQIDRFDGLLVIDGVIVDVGEGQSPLDALEPLRIERVEVIKGRAAQRMYDDPRAARGVIRITTRDGAPTL